MVQIAISIALCASMQHDKVGKKGIIMAFTRIIVIKIKKENGGIMTS